MKVKTKKLIDGRRIKIESGGEIKEILIHTDIMSPDREKISICYRGQKNSGVIELTNEEVEHLYKTIHSKIKLVRSFKIIRE
jgi:hypothetical protein